MKFALAYYLVLIYATVILNPIIPVAEDAVMHCFAEAYHVATVHAKYGNNHLEVALANDAKDDDSKNQTSTKYGEQSTVHISIIGEVSKRLVKINPGKYIISPINFALHLF